MATLQNIGKLKYRGKDGLWHPLPVVVQDAGGGVSTISGKGAPTSATQGKINQLYRNEDTQKLYICTETAGGYTWAAVVSDTEDAVTYTAQTLTEEQKTQARSNIGAGTSNFSGSYNDLSNKPNIPAATVIDTTLTKSGQAADAKAAGDAIGKKIDAPHVAQVGEVLTVEEVNADGKPTKWKTAPAAAERKQADWNQNDSSAADYVKNRTHYEESIYVDYVLNMSGTEIVGLSMPEVGETMTVKINGVESAETVKEAESSILGTSYKYIGNIDADSLLSGGIGWCVVSSGGQVSGIANPDTEMSIENIIFHKINDKFLNYDGFVRTFDYHFKNYTIYKTLYKDNGDQCLLYMCDNFIFPEIDSQLFGLMNRIGFASVGSVGVNSCFVIGYIINSDGNITVINTVFGTDTSDMERIAASYGYTLTTNPKA